MAFPGADYAPRPLSISRYDCGCPGVQAKRQRA